MKIIDEKGRLFGKINIVDFFVILLLLCILPAFYLGYKIMSKKSIVLENKPVEIAINCQLIKVRPEVLKLISVGDKELDKNGQVIGEIIDLGESSPYKYRFNIGGKEDIIKEDAYLKQIEAKFKLKTEINENKLFYKNFPIQVGLLLQFKTNKYDVFAIPLQEKEAVRLQEKETVRLVAVFKNLMPEVSNVIKKGDREIEFAEDNSSKVISEVIRIIANQPAEFISLTETGKDWQIIGHPKNKDIILEIETLCVRLPSGLSLKNKPVKIGDTFDFFTDLYSISGIIIGIERK